MTHRVLAVLVLALAAPSHAAPTAYLHHAASPVAVPGGTTQFFMDDQSPLAPTPAVEPHTVPAGATVSFPTFTRVAFSADTPLDPFASPDVFLSADQEMTDCVDVTLSVARVNSSGGATLLGTRQLVEATVPQSADGGLTGFQDFGLLISIGDGVVAHAGEAVAVTLTVANHCGADRTVWLSYDSSDADAMVRFVPISEVEFKCEIKTAATAGNFLRNKARVLDTCASSALDGLVPSSDCVPPYGGGTASRVAGIEIASQQREATCPACPTCYSGGDCTADGTARVAGLESLTDALMAQMRCDDSGSGDGLTSTESRCQHAVSAMFGMLASRTLACLAACRHREFKGRSPLGSCTPPVSDVRTQQCLSRLEARVVTSIDRYCQDDPPECYTLDGAGWVDSFRSTVQGLDGGLFCASLTE